MPKQSEVDRLLEVYKGYATNPAKQAQWDKADPGNAAMLGERSREMSKLLHLHGLFPLENKRILEIGCGGGNVLAGLLEWGARPENLLGVDLVPERIEQARRQYPTIRFECANAEQLNLPSATFDLMLFFTVFSSILDEEMRHRLAGEAVRLVRNGGGILWYDFRFDNPGNPHVRGVRRKDVQRLFPSVKVSLRTITLLPPLARRLGRFTKELYPPLSKIPLLRTHYLGLFMKRGS